MHNKTIKLYIAYLAVQYKTARANAINTSGICIMTNVCDYISSAIIIKC